MFRNKITYLYLLVLTLGLSLGLSLSTHAVAADVLETTDQINFETEGQSVWGENIDPAALLTPIEIDLPILHEVSEPLDFGVTKRFLADFGTATRTGDLEFDLFCSEDEFGFEGNCYSCSTNFDPAASTAISILNGEAVCVDDTDISPPIERGSATLLPECPSGSQYDSLSGVCYDTCPSGSVFNSITQTCVETIVVPEVATCSNGQLVGNECLSCGSDRELVVDLLLGGLACEKPKALSKMVAVGYDRVENVCTTPCVGGDKICPPFLPCYTTPKVCKTVCADVPYIEGEVTANASNGAYYGCPDSNPTQNFGEPFNNTGICFKDYANVAASKAAPSCRGNIQPALGLCAGDIHTNVAIYETPGLGCEAGSFLDDQKPGACFHCKETEIWTPSNPVTNPGAPDSCTSVSYATLSVNEPTLGCDSGFPFVDPLNPAVQGCYSCDVDDMSPTLIFPLSSDKACFGFTEGSGPTSFELGYRVEGEVGLRVGLKNELTFNGGTVDVNYATGVTTTLEPNSDDPTKFKLIASMGEGAPEISSTTPGMKFTSDAYSEFYGNAALTIKYPDFDADGIPFQAEERIQLIDAASGGEDSGETGPLGEGVDYTRLFLYEFGFDRVILEYIEFPDIPSLLPLPVLEAELDLEINAPPSPDFALDTPAIDIDPMLGALEGIVSNLGWLPIKTFKRPYKGFEVQCLWHKEKPVNNEAFKAIFGEYPLDFTGVVPPCQEFALAAVYVAIPNLSTPPNSLVGEPSCFTPEGVVSCFNGLWRTDLSSDDLYGIKRQFLGVRSRSIDPFSPYDPFYSPPAQTTDFLRLELDIDGVATLAAPPGVQISRDFTSTLPVLKYFKVNVELFDINLFANFAFNKSEVFTPRLNVTYHFSENVIIDGLSVREYEMPVRTEAYAAESLCEPDDVDGEALCHDSLAESEPELFNEVEFQHTGGDLQITKTFSIDGHTLNEKLILHFQPLLEGKLFNLSVKVNDDKLKKILPSFSASALQYTIDPFDVYQPILDNTSQLDGFDDVEGEVALRLRVPELDLDGDDDGVRDGLDNCIDALNPDQNDLDQDSLGDACDTDIDGDGYFAIGAGGNDPNDYDATEVPDSDGDGADDNTDNCRLIANAAQSDFDGDGIGDICDADFVDTDLDLITDVIDNCVFDANTNQSDIDEDGFGDACDPAFGLPTHVDFDFYPDGTEVQDRDTRGTAPYASVGLLIDGGGAEPRIERDSNSFSAPNLLKERDGKSSQTTLIFVDPVVDPGVDPNAGSLGSDPQAVSVKRLELVVLGENKRDDPHVFELYDDSLSLMSATEYTIRRQLLSGSDYLYIFEGEFHQLKITNADNSASEFDDIIFHATDDTAPVITVPSSSLTLMLAADQTTIDLDVSSIVATDNVDGSIAVVCAPVTALTVGETVVECVAFDYAGNQTTSQIQVTVLDVTPPIISVDQSFTFALQDDQSAMTVNLEVTAEDAVDGSSLATCQAPILSVGEYEVTCSATDSSGNKSTTNVNVIINDVTPPVLQLAALQTIALGSAEATKLLIITAKAIDNVDGEIDAVCESSTFGIGQVTLTCVATDSSGNSATGSTVVSVVDVTAPVLVMPESLIIEGNTYGGAIFSLEASAIDVVDGNIAPSCTGEQTVYPVGSTTVQCSASDLSGNTALGSVSITVVDTTSPLLAPIASEVLSLADNQSDVNFTIPALFGVDIVDGEISAECGVRERILNVGETTVSCSVTDSAGNTAVQSFSVTVNDLILPVIIAPANIALSFDAINMDPEVTGLAVLTDNVQPSGTLSYSDNAESVFAAGVTSRITRTWTGVDIAGNEALPVQQIITLRDDSAPIIVVTNVTLEFGEDASIDALGEAVASDNSDEPVQLSSTDLVFDDRIERTWLAIDWVGNEKQVVQVIQYLDTTPPTILIPPSVELEYGSDTSALTLGTATADDAVDGLLEAVFEDQLLDGEGAVVQIIRRTWSAQDLSGNQVSEIQEITLKDTTAPALVVPVDANLFVGDATGTDATGLASATDIYDAFATVTYSDSSVSGTGLVIQVITRNWTVTDSVGNTASGVQIITVSESDTQPIASINASALAGYIPLNVDLAAAVEEGNGPLSYQWIVGDNVYTTSTVQLNIDVVGNYLVQLTVTDKNGDMSSASVVVEANEVPISDLLAKVEVLKASRQSLKSVDQTAKSEHKLAVQALRSDIDTERQAEKVRHALIKQTINDLRDVRRATSDDELKIILGDQIAEQYAARQESALLSLQRTQRFRREIVELRDERQFARENYLSALLEINGDISALRLEIRLRRPGSSAELDLVGHEIFEMQSQSRDLRARQALLKSESSAAINSLQEQMQVDKLALKVAQKSKSNDIRTVRALQRREKDKSVRVMLKAEFDLLKLDAKALKTAAKLEVSAIKSEISLIRDNVKSARETTRDADRGLRDQIKALRNVKLVQVN